MNFMLFTIKFIKFKPIIKFKKFECHNNSMHKTASADVALLSYTCHPQLYMRSFCEFLVQSELRLFSEQ